MSKGLKIGLIVIAIILVIAVIFGTTYNSLVKLDETVQSQYSTISVQLQRRNDLIPNLVNTVKGYAAHETEAIDAVTSARAKLAGAATPEETAAADTELTSALNRLMVIVENYPDLKASENFQQLSDELAGTENRISVARQDYNTAAKALNTKLRSFPTNIIASMMQFSQATYFEATAGAENVPEVNF